MKAEWVAGDKNPFVSTRTFERSNKDGQTVEVVGLYSDLKDKIPAYGQTSDECEYIANGMVVQSASLRPNGDGMGTLTIVCASYGVDNGINTDTESETWTVEMQEVQQDLQCHPYIIAEDAARQQVIAWLATEEKYRIELKTVKDKKTVIYKYAPTDWNGDVGALKDVENARAKAFCDAYMDGIRTFNRYMPVVERTSVYRRLPGGTVNGAKVTGGTALFSDKIGKFDDPALGLQGYKTGQEGKWFKSRDSYRQNADSTWTRVEQWTWSPGNRHKWVYDNIDDKGQEGK